MNNRAPELRICLDDDEICIDNFAGGGGASTGMDQVLAEFGRHVDVAVNHDAEAIALHKANHPHTEHYVTDVFHVDIVEACRGRRVGFAWYSPDCTYHSKARGGKPFRHRNKARRVRGLAWVIIKQAKELLAAGLGPRVIAMENVQEFADWGPLDADGEIIQLKKGVTFRRWCRQLQNLGYEIDMWELRGDAYGAPTTRERLFIVARNDGAAIVKPEPTHGRGMKPVRTAAECIDFSIPCPSIFDRKKPLAENTMKRIFEGIRRYVVDTPNPFIVPVNHSDKKGRRVHSIEEPLRTITASRRGDFAIATPVIARIGQTGGGGKYCNSVEAPLSTVTTKAEHLVISPVLMKNMTNNVSRTPEEPLSTILTGNHHFLVAPHLVPRYSERPGQAPRTRSVQLPLPTIVTTDNGAQLVSAYLAKQNGVGEKIVIGQDLAGPVHTITTKDQKALVTSHLLKLKHHSVGQSLEEPIHTIQAGGTHYAEVRAFLIKYYGAEQHGHNLQEPLDTITTKDRFGLVTVRGEDYAIVDIGLRMLTPRELYLAQGFPRRYKIAVKHNGKRLTKTAQVRMCGNSVCPPLAAAIMRAQLVPRAADFRRAA